MSELAYPMVASWLHDPQPAASVGERLIKTLDRLRQSDPAVDHWWLLDPDRPRPIPVQQLPSDIVPFVEACSWQDDFGEPQPSGGFYITAGGSPDRIKSNSQVTLVIIGGSVWNNQIEFNLGPSMRPVEPSQITYGPYRSAIEILASEWACPWLSANCYVLDQEPLTEPFENAWLAYLSPTLAAGLTPPPELITERTPGGGFILSAATERLDPNNADHVARSRMLEAILSERVGVKAYNGPTENKLSARIGPY